MKLPRRNFLHLVAATAALPAVSHVARANVYPSRPVHLITGFPAGMSADVIARLMGQWLSERLGQPFVVENRPGAGSNIGTEIVAKAPADGYTLLMAVSTNTVNATLYPNLNFSFVRDFEPVGSIASTPYVMVVTPSFPAKSLSEFIAYTKANPGKVNMASGGVGSTPHIVGELFKIMAGVPLVHVPYRGSFMPDLLSGQVQVTFPPVATIIEHVRAGKLRALAVTTARRLEAMPEIPSVSEFVPGYEAVGWYGLCAPKGTAPAIVEKLNTTINIALADSEIKARLGNLGVAPMPMTPADFGKLIANDTDKWAKVIQTANIKPE